MAFNDNHHGEGVIVLIIMGIVFTMGMLWLAFYYYGAPPP